MIFSGRDVGIKGEIPVTRHMVINIAIQIDIVSHFYVGNEI